MIEPIQEVKESCSRLALGTAQFGMNYGVANRSGQVSSDEVASILKLARKRGVDTLDTAMDYGSSELALGANQVSDFSVITKLSALPDDVADVDGWVQTKMAASLARLRLDCVDGLLLHRPHQLLGAHGQSLSDALQRLKSEGLVKKIGVSIYSPDELDTVLQACPIDLVQAPFNLVDRRLHASGWMDKLHQSGIEIHVRSAFLQGVLLMPPSSIPEKFARWSATWGKWHDWLRATGASAVNACLGFTLSFPQISRVVVGVDSAMQFEQLLEAAQAPAVATWPSIGLDDEMLVNPAKWNEL